MRTYKTTVGIEVHAELTTKSKMFCGCVNDPHHGEPNAYTCPVCLAHPGTLPVVNREAVEKVRTVGAAIGGTLADFSEFDRKNYFYPDIPKAYQISQYAHPLVRGGEIAGVAITRIHLEEDTARSQHDQGEGSLVDFNRAGVPLMELVTEPVIHDPETAGNFGRELQLLLRTLGVSNANMERGELRVEANISVSADEQKLGTKVEVKNLNSFRAMEAAIAYEVARQIELLEKGERVVQETRGWDESKGATFVQRSKETAEDYRYFPDPDIPKYQFTAVPEMSISRLTEKLPTLPTELRVQYRDLGLSLQQIEALIFNQELGGYFATYLTSIGHDSKLAVSGANYLTSDAVGILEQGAALPTATVPQFAALMQLLANSQINSRTAKDLLPEVLLEGKDPTVLANERGLIQKNSAEDLYPVVDAIIAEHANVVAEYKAGKEASLQFLVGQGMKATRGAANPTLLAELLKARM